MGSKYVQSRTGNTFEQAKKFLQEGRRVLFTGTPCQIAGIKSFLREEYNNLLTVDVICHGVPSPKVWQMYLEELKKSDTQIMNISFRDKRSGWKNFSLTFSLEKSLRPADEVKESASFSHSHGKDMFFLGFNDYNLFLRPSCYACPVRGLRSGSDITIADFWGINSLMPAIDDDKGCSVIIVNTKKGWEIIDTTNAKLYDVKFDDIVSRNTSLYEDSKLAKATLIDFFRYGVRLQTKRDYFFFDHSHSISDRVLILSNYKFYNLLRKIKHFLRRPQ